MPGIWNSRLLLTEGADINGADEEGSTALHCASNGKVNIINALLDAGADVNIQGDEGATIHQAAWFGSLDTVKLLLKRGADVNVVRKGDGHTALSEAVARGKGDVVKTLLEASFEFSVRTLSHALTYASGGQQGDIGAMEAMLLEKVKIISAEVDMCASKGVN